ncbi:MAG: hypothetical protein J6B12_01775 [Clostridia bacterium]|nr:hypothetical protein [Clostridia bacterium]
MTYLEIDKALVEITRAKCTECKARLDAVSKENATERKALQVEYGMYTFCGNAGLLFNTVGERKIVQIRRRFFEKELYKYQSLKAIYQGLDEQEKMRFVAALQPEWYIRYYWLGAQKIELAAAEESGDAKKAFEFKIKVGAVENMFAAWEAWRRENGVYPNMFEEGKND